MTGPSENEIASRLDQAQETLWVCKARNGDHEAFLFLVKRYERRIFYYLMRFTQNPDQAADVIQEIWITAFRGIRELRKPEAFRIWLYQIAHDKTVSSVRREARRDEVLEQIVAEPALNDSFDDCSFEHAELVHRALGRLSPEHREVLTLRFLEDLKLEEIAEALRCQLGTVKSRLHYAKLEMRKLLEEESNE